MTQVMQGAQTPSRRAVGQWIWIEGEAKPYNFYLYARGTVDVDGAPAAEFLSTLKEMLEHPKVMPA